MIPTDFDFRKHIIDSINAANRVVKILVIPCYLCDFQRVNEVISDESIKTLSHQRNVDLKIVVCDKNPSVNIINLDENALEEICTW